ncbi:ParB N-terminal domain-containing protein [candidate division KSB1 bacterium]|nr:ParB N-terminal domain-containing protein [candidate division KSB1 bacterium]MBL7092643.1 ParB N-terminal domain-containing protein [candidate division KSB1 bacterium]
MKIKIDDIKISARIRIDNTDISQLKKSIEEIGLLNPIIVDEENELLSGFRRLTACRELGWEEIDAVVFKTSDNEVKKLDIEFHENLGRIDLSNDDRLNYLQMRHDLLSRPKRKSPWYYFKKLWDLFFGLFNWKKK